MQLVKNLFLGAFAAMTFAACGSDDLAVVEDPNWDQFGNGYLAFSVNMPTDKVSRGDNDIFDRGTAWEYAIKDVGLMIFKGTSEADAVYEQFVNVSDVDFGDPNDPDKNITLDKKYVAKIVGMDKAPTDHFYALAVINRNNVIHFHNGELTVGGNEISAGSTKFSDIQKFIVNTSLYANGGNITLPEVGEVSTAELWTQEGGILMLNAPLAATTDNKPGSTTTEPSGAQLNILQDVSSSIFNSETEAHESTSYANIYVERAIAKVSVGYAAKTGVAKDKDNNNLFSWSIDAWRLDNTNTKSYVLRNMENFEATKYLHSYQNNIYRMIGGVSVLHDKPISMGTPDLNDRFRTYFAIDPNYDKAGDFNAGSSSNSTFGSDFAQYCAENVFNVRHQIWGQTTRVLVKAILTPQTGESLFAHPGDDKFLTISAVEDLAFNAALAKYRDHVKALRNANLLTGTISRSDATVTVDTEGKDHVAVSLDLSKVTVASGISDADVAAAGIPGVTTLDHVRAIISADSVKDQEISHTAMGVRWYNGGAAYYQVRIKHFGDELTPWNDHEFNGADNAPVAGGVDASYKENDRREHNYLGRYGVLRNNWYLVNLSNVIKIGYPSVDDLKLDGTGSIHPETPDDHIDKDQWINAEVNILSWAKRFQNNTLGED